MIPVGLVDELVDDSGTATTEVVASAHTEADIGGGPGGGGGIGRRNFGAAGGFGNPLSLKTMGGSVACDDGTTTSGSNVASIGLPAADPHGTSGALTHGSQTPVSGWT